MRKVRQNPLFFVIVKNANKSRRLGGAGLSSIPSSPRRGAVMPPKTKKKPSLSTVSAPRPGRGRPRKFVDPEALIPFEKKRGDASAENFEKKAKKSATSKRKEQRMSPVTSDRSYTADEVEFMNALAEFKRISRRTFPTCSEILSILRGLGYEKVMQQGNSDTRVCSDKFYTANG